MQVSSRWLKLCCSLEFGDCGLAVRVQAGVQAQDTSEGTVCFRIVWSNSHSLARLRFGIFQLAVLSKRICKIDACLREIGFQAQGSAELCDCWLELPLIQQNPAQRVVRFRTLGASFTTLSKAVRAAGRFPFC